MKPAAPAARARNGAFTLLEILAVVAILALISSVVMPNFSGLHARTARNQAREMVTRIELARQRAIVTGIPHRIFIDIDAGAYRVEWLGRDEAEDEFEVQLEDDYADGGDFNLDLSAPRDEEREFGPLTGQMGRFVDLGASSGFSSIETTGGWVDTGETSIRFEQDGSAEATTVVIEHEAGYAATLEVLPLASTVRVVHETL